MQHPWPSTDHYRRTLENRSPTSFESRTLMNIRFRRQHGPTIPVSNTNTFTSEIKQSQADTKPQKTKYAQTRHKNLINLGEDTRTPTINTPRQQYERQPTRRIESPRTTGRFTPSEFSRADPPIILLSICIRTRVHTWWTRERTARRTREQEQEERTNHPRKNNGCKRKSSNESSVVEEENREERKPWRRNLTSMTWSPVIF